MLEEQEEHIEYFDVDRQLAEGNVRHLMLWDVGDGKWKIPKKDMEKLVNDAKKYLAKTGDVIRSTPVSDQAPRFAAKRVLVVLSAEQRPAPTEHPIIESQPDLYRFSSPTARSSVLAAGSVRDVRVCVK
ncbi:MAG: hypothetical protein WB679_06390 [Terracidiphilus sp.]